MILYSLEQERFCQHQPWPDLKFFQMMRRSKSAVYSQSTGTEKFESLQKGLGTNFWASHDAAVCRLNETKTKCKVDIAFISWKNKERRKVTETLSTSRTHHLQHWVHLQSSLSFYNLPSIFLKISRLLVSHTLVFSGSPFPKLYKFWSPLLLWVLRIQGTRGALPSRFLVLLKIMQDISIKSCPILLNPVINSLE